MEHYQIEHLQTTICTPNTNDLVNLQKPYWAKIWHSAIALSKFLVKNNHLLTNKKVLELAAGLGLPSMIAAKYAKEVICSDAAIESLVYTKETAKYNKIENIIIKQLNWNYLHDDLNVDILLLSDVNYEPTEFDSLYNVFREFCKKGTTIILATPQRLMAKPFIEKILPLCELNEEMEVTHLEETAFINILVLNCKQTNFI